MTTELPNASPVAAYRADKDRFLREDRRSPLWGDDAFEGLAYYPETDAYRVAARVERLEPEPVVLSTNTGDERLFLTYGVARFELSGAPHSLTLFAPPEAPEGPRLFVPFRDETSGSETYGAGRYLDVTLSEDAEGSGTLDLDFNYAYHPFCAYVEGYSCPMPPASNWLEVAVEAGERLPRAARAEAP